MVNRRRPTYAPEFRAEALKRVRNSSDSVSAIARDLGITVGTLRRWIDASRPAPEAPRTGAERGAGGAPTPRRTRGVEAPAERGARAADGARHPKKSDGLLRQAERVRFAFIAAEKAGYPIRTLCRCLQLAPSGYYAWVRRGPSPRTQQDLELIRRLRQVHARTRQVYGHPRLHRALRQEGHRVSAKRVARLMRTAGASGPGRGRFSGLNRKA